MRLKCSFCDKTVSTEIDDGVIYDCWIECPECIEKEYSEIPESKKLLVKKFNKAEKLHQEIEKNTFII